MRQKIVDEIKRELEKVLGPFEGILGIGSDFYNSFIM